MYGYRFRLPIDVLCGGLWGFVLLGTWLVAWSILAIGATLEKRSEMDAPMTSDYVPPTPPPAPATDQQSLPLNTTPPVPQPGPLVPGFAPGPFPPVRPPEGPPPPGAVCRPVPMVVEPVAALGVTVTWPAEGGGVLVLDVAPFSPAAHAGLLRGDRIQANDHQLISTPRILVGYIRHKLAGDRIWIAYWRYGVIQSTNTVLIPKGAIPAATPETQAVPAWQADRGPTRPRTEEHEIVLAECIP